MYILKLHQFAIICATSNATLHPSSFQEAKKRKASKCSLAEKVLKSPGKKRSTEIGQTDSLGQENYNNFPFFLLKCAKSYLCHIKICKIQNRKLKFSSLTHIKTTTQTTKYPKPMKHPTNKTRQIP